MFEFGFSLHVYITPKVQLTTFAFLSFRYIDIRMSILFSGIYVTHFLGISLMSYQQAILVQVWMYVWYVHTYIHIYEHILYILAILWECSIDYDVIFSLLFVLQVSLATKGDVFNAHLFVLRSLAGYDAAGYVWVRAIVVGLLSFNQTPTNPSRPSIIALNIFN